MAQPGSRKWQRALPQLVLFILLLDWICGVGISGATAQERTESVKPGINEQFLNPELRVEEWVERFETESREVFTAREEILEALGLEEGMRVADVGAGTGLFTGLFSQQVGPRGWVFAVDISPRFAEHLARRADRSRLSNITPVLCAEDSVLLPPESVDMVFVCDTYHHFEYPAATLASIRRALRPGGHLAVIDFERIPGVSREWTLDHVRAGKETFRGEIEMAGFELDRELDLDGLEENYFLLFRKP
jgi:SAM-dependent methyltransferase